MNSNSRIENMFSNLLILEKKFDEEMYNGL